MKANGGGRSIPPLILNVSTKWRSVLNFTLQPLYPRRKNPQYSLNGKVGGPQKWSGLNVVFHKK